MTSLGASNLEWTSLHPLDLGRVAAYLRQLKAPAPHDEREANALTLGLARFIAEDQPIFFQPGLSLTTFEARIDRGIGTLMRPPSRLFADAGLDPVAARALPIRLDVNEGMMGGAFVPPRLMPNMRAILDERMKRILRRLNDADYDAVASLGLLIEAVDFAAARGLGLYEAIDVIDPDSPSSWPAGAQVLEADVKRLDRDLRKRLEAAAKPDKKPGMLQRMLGRPASSET
jgi:hypothetical protein